MKRTAHDGWEQLSGLTNIIRQGTLWGRGYSIQLEISSGMELVDTITCDMILAEDLGKEKADIHGKKNTRSLCIQCDILADMERDVVGT